MLENECEAVAIYVGELLAHSPTGGVPLAGEQGALFVSSLSSALQSLVALTRRRVLQEVQAGKRAIVVSLDASRCDGPLALAADDAEIWDVAERLAFARSWLPKMFNGYAIVHEDEALRVLYPALQTHLDAIRVCLECAARTPSGRFLEAQTSDGLRGVVLQEYYPAYYVYQLQERSHASGGWKPLDRAGHDQLVALLSHAYHKGHWFVRGDTVAQWVSR
jgi:hypothetical protein